MSKTREQRVDDALSQLIERLTPYLEDEDEASADEKFQTNLEHARNSLDTNAAPAVAQDVGHVSELIKRKRQ